VLLPSDLDWKFGIAFAAGQLSQSLLSSPKWVHVSPANWTLKPPSGKQADFSSEVPRLSVHSGNFLAQRPMAKGSALDATPAAKPDNPHFVHRRTSTPKTDQKLKINRSNTGVFRIKTFNPRTSARPNARLFVYRKNVPATRSFRRHITI